MQDEKLIRVAGKKDQILKLFRQKGLRITKQRKLILDIVFEHECTCCKEIYYQALKKDKNVGIATVYRMVNVLMDLGVFQVHAPYRLSGGCENGCRVVLKNQAVVEFGPEEWQSILSDALEKKGYVGEQEIEKVIL
ncbi:MAG: Fur family transcriptional regulator [Lachnospiraceae bacterium]|nr:Fur family transcriptional regulator [Lachnospiraceae bacterium]